MSDLIEIYIYDVTRRLPEEERKEVAKELEANIYDMLPENAGKEEIKAVLYELGSPAKLAEEYRQHPRYLISPMIYDEYIKILKWVVPVVGVVFLVIGLISGAVSSFSGDGLIDITEFVSNIISKGISMGIRAALQATVWTTIAFVIVERTGYKSGKYTEWNVEDLPEIERNEKYRIPTSDIVVELILSTIFTIIAVLFLSGVLPFANLIQIDGIKASNIFVEGFMHACIPAILISWLFNSISCVIKLKDRRWTLNVCVALIIDHIVGILVFLFVIAQSPIFTSQFLTMVARQEWVSGNMLEIMKQPFQSFVIVPILLLMIVAAVCECGMAIYRMIKSKEYKNLS